MEEKDIDLLTSRLLKITGPEPDDDFTKAIMQKVIRKEQTNRQLAQIQLYVFVLLGTLAATTGIYLMAPHLSAIMEILSAPMQTVASAVENPMPGVLQPTLFLGLLSLPVMLYILDAIVSDILGYSIFKI